MTEDEFRAAMAEAKREGRLLFVANDDARGIAVGCNSGRSVIILHGGREIPMATARKIVMP